MKLDRVYKIADMAANGMATVQHVKELVSEIGRLRLEIAYLGEIADACTYRTLGMICSTCRCHRKQP